MTTTGQGARTGDRDGSRTGAGQGSADVQVEEVTRRVADVVNEASAEAGVRLAEVAETAGEAVRDIDRQLHTSSDQTLGLLGALSVGLAVGLLIGGANRLLVVIAMVPAAVVAGILVERMDRAPVTSAGRSR